MYNIYLYSYKYLTFHFEGGLLFPLPERVLGNDSVCAGVILLAPTDLQFILSTTVFLHVLDALSQNTSVVMPDEKKKKKIN